MFEEDELKIITLNIQKGWSLGRFRATVDQIKNNIVEKGATLVFLQEVVGAFPELSKKSQFEFLADGIWSHFAYGKNAIHSKGHHGNAILSRLPFVRYQNIDISNHRFERRGILHGVIALPSSAGQEKELHVVSAHFDLTNWGRTRQREKLCEFIEQSVPPNAPLIVCGDFNDWRESLTSYLSERVYLKEAFMTNGGAHAKTFPTYYPLLKLDRIYYRNLSLKSAARLDSPQWHRLSDHLGLYAELSF